MTEKIETGQKNTENLVNRQYQMNKTSMFFHKISFSTTNFLTWMLYFL